MSSCPQPARSPEVAHGRSSWQLQAASQHLLVAPTLPPAFLSPYISGPSEKPEASLLIDCHSSCYFHISDSFHFCYPQPVPPILDDTRHPVKTALIQKAICRCRRWPPALTVFPQREPLHHRRELHNHTKTNFFLLVIIWWSHYQTAWGLWVLKATCQKYGLVCFLGSDKSNVFSLSTSWGTYQPRPQRLRTLQAKKRLELDGITFGEEGWLQAWFLRQPFNITYPKGSGRERLDSGPCQYQRRPPSRKLWAAITLGIKHLALYWGIQNKVLNGDQGSRTQSPGPGQCDWQNPGSAQGRVPVLVELAERSSCLDGVSVGRRRHLRTAKGRPGFITAKEPGLQQPTKCQIWNHKRSQGQGRLRKGGKGLQGQQSNKSQGRWVTAPS